MRVTPPSCLVHNRSALSFRAVTVRTVCRLLPCAVLRQNLPLPLGPRGPLSQFHQYLLSVRVQGPGPGPWPWAARSVSGDVQAGLRGAVSMATGLTQPGVAVPVTSAAELSWPLPPFPAFTLLRESGGRRKGFPVSAVTWCVFSRSQQAEFSSPVC